MTRYTRESCNRPGLEPVAAISLVGSSWLIIRAFCSYRLYDSLATLVIFAWSLTGGESDLNHYGDPADSRIGEGCGGAEVGAYYGVRLSR